MSVIAPCGFAKKTKLNLASFTFTKTVCFRCPDINELGTAMN